MWFKAEYKDSDGNKINKRSNEEIYIDIKEKLDPKIN